MSVRGATQEHANTGQSDRDFYNEIEQKGGETAATHGADFYRKIGHRGRTHAPTDTPGNGAPRIEGHGDEENDADASGSHHTAAGFHESAAYHHRRAADAHAQGRHEEGQHQARTAHAHSKNAHNHTVEAGRRSHPKGTNN